MKGKILLIIYGILSCTFIYGRIINDLDLAALSKYFLIVPLIAYYIISAKKTDYKFVIVLVFYALGDILFTLPEYQYGGFGSYLLANISLSLLILNRLKIITNKSFLSIVGLIAAAIFTVLYVFHENPVFEKVFVWIFHISVGTIFVTTYIRHNKVTKPFSILMLLATLLFVICNFLANMNYFVVNYIFFRTLISVFYVFYLLGITYAITMEDKELTLN